MARACDAVSGVCLCQSELSQLIHSLSDKARSGTEFIARLKSMHERIEVCRLPSLAFTDDRYTVKISWLKFHEMFEILKRLLFRRFLWEFHVAE